MFATERADAARGDSIGDCLIVKVVDVQRISVEQLIRVSARIGGACRGERRSVHYQHRVGGLSEVADTELWRRNIGEIGRASGEAGPLSMSRAPSRLSCSTASSGSCVIAASRFTNGFVRLLTMHSSSSLYMSG